MIRTLAACIALVATPAFASGPFVSLWNGYSMVIVEPSTKPSTVPNEATVAKAGAVCASVGKSAELQEGRMVSDFRSEFFFICM